MLFRGFAVSILVLVAAGWSPATVLAESSATQAGEGDLVAIPRAEYEQLREEAGLYRQRHSEEGLGNVLFRLQIFGWTFKATWWKLLGSLAALLFAGRWLGQMYYSRKLGRPVIPRAYWIISVTASVMLLSYWILSPQRAVVGVLQNLFPVFVAAYNLYLDIRYQQKYGGTAQNLGAVATAPELSASRESHQTKHAKPETFSVK